MKLAVVGGGWAGIAAAVRACEAGHQVALLEMATQLGGRAREVVVDGIALDNGQHILIGAYQRTLALMRTVGADIEGGLHRMPLELRYPDGLGLRVPPGPPWLAFGRAVFGCKGWNGRDRLSLLSAAARWARAGFRCDPKLTVDELCEGLTPPVRQLLIDPLCIAALNTPAREASAAVLLRVLRDALFGPRGSADLLLPRRSLGTLLPQPAQQWLQQRGAEVRLNQRVQKLARSASGWAVDGECFDAVLLACTAVEAARLVQHIAPEWAGRATALNYEPIVTVYLRCLGAKLPSPMTALIDHPQAPAQFALDHGALGGTPGVFAFVISGARHWVAKGLNVTSNAVIRQAIEAFPKGTWPAKPLVLRALAEKRATFRCWPNLDRPPALIAPGLVAAGDYIEGPYPATLEGAVMSADGALALLR